MIDYRVSSLEYTKHDVWHCYSCNWQSQSSINNFSEIFSAQYVVKPSLKILILMCLVDPPEFYALQFEKHFFDLDYGKIEYRCNSWLFLSKEYQCLPIPICGGTKILNWHKVWIFDKKTHPRYFSIRPYNPVRRIQKIAKHLWML